MPTHGHFKPATERCSVNGHHNRLGGILHSQHQWKQGRFPLGPTGNLAELLDISTRDECAATANQHNGLHLGVLSELF